MSARLAALRKGELTQEDKRQIEEYDAIRRTAEEFVSGRYRAIVGNITELYAAYTEKDADGKLWVTGRERRSLAVTRENCAEVCRGLHQEMKACVAQLAEGGFGFAPDPSVLAQVYRCYNAYVDVARQAAALSEGVRRTAEGLRAERIRALSLRVRRAEEQILAQTASDAGADLNGSEEVATDFGEITLPIGRSTLALSELGKSVALFCKWSLRRHGCLYVEADEREITDEGICMLIENTVLKFLCAYPGTHKQIMVCDPSCDARLISFVTGISRSKGCEKFFPTSSDGERSCLVETGLDELMRRLSGLQITERIATTGGDLFAYNASSPANPYAPVLVVLRGFCRREGHAGAQELRSILKNGSKAGVYFLIVDTPYGGTSPRREADIVPEDAMRLYYRGAERAVLDVGLQERYSVEALRGSGFSVGQYLKRLSAVAEAENSHIPLFSLPSARGSSEYSSVLHVPIGKEGGKSVVLSLRIESPMAHCAITGTSGSGKSSLMHDIILGCADAYLPSEVEMWLFDFKTGSELAPYEQLKHVRRLSLNNKSKDAQELMRDILNQMRKRHESFKRAEVNNITDYNLKMRRLGRTEMPRLLIFIDEYTEIRSLRCISDFETVALQGRSAGISFIISAVTHDSLFKNITDQANHKFEFRSNRLGALIPSCGDKDVPFLRALAGNCIYSDGAVSRRMRCAYAGSTERIRAQIARINEKYAAFSCDRPLDGTRPISRTGDGDRAETVALYRAKRRISVPLGVGRDGEETVLSLGRDRTMTVFLGDEARCANAEYGVIGRALHLKEDRSNVYYLDLYRSADRLPNVIADGVDRAYSYARSNREIAEAVRELYGVFLKREALHDDNEPIGGPIVLMLHGAEYLTERARVISDHLKGRRGEREKGKASVSPEEAAERILRDLDASSAEPSRADDGETDVMRMLSKLVTFGAYMRIYTTVHFENPREMNATLSRILLHRGEARGYVVLPTPAEGDTAPASYITDHLSAIGIGTSDYEKDGGTVSASELSYAFLIDGGVVTRFIPYENGDGSAV